MSIVKFYRGDPNAPKTTMPAHLGANVILTCKGRLLLEKRRDSDTWGLVGGGVKKTEEPIQAIARKYMRSLVCGSRKNGSPSYPSMANRGVSPPTGTAVSGGW